MRSEYHDALFVVVSGNGDQIEVFPLFRSGLSCDPGVSGVFDARRAPNVTLTEPCVFDPMRSEYHVQCDAVFGAPYKDVTVGPEGFRLRQHGSRPLSNVTVTALTPWKRATR
jgi:hypothetical protein